jgi:triosephosphate isomerase
MSAERPPNRRRRVVAANWKMNLLKAEAIDFCRALRRGLVASDALLEQTARIVIFPSFPLIPVVARELVDSEVAVGGQDLHPEDKGAHTGDVSGRQLADAGCSWVLCGHSERRRDHRESDELIARKVATAIRHGLTPMLCVGETRTQRKAGRTFEVLERQLRRALAGRPEPVAIAYEPVWAIGTGDTATPETAQEAHDFMRGVVEELMGEGAPAIPIVYGGSVTPENADGLIEQEAIDGFLVGGASLDPHRFLAIIRVSG